MPTPEAIRLARRLYEDRDRLAGEIHDGFVQYVVGGKMWLESLEDEALTENGKAALTTALDALADGVASARTLVTRLRTRFDGSKPFDEAISHGTLRYRSSVTHNVQLQVEGDFSAFSDDLNFVASGIAHDLFSGVLDAGGQITKVFVDGQREQLEISIHLPQPVEAAQQLDPLKRLLETLGSELVIHDASYKITLAFS